jgi:hypothetical protein
MHTTSHFYHREQTIDMGGILKWVLVIHPLSFVSNNYTGGRRSVSNYLLVYKWEKHRNGVILCIGRLPAESLVQHGDDLQPQRHDGPQMSIALAGPLNRIRHDQGGVACSDGGLAETKPSGGE